MVVSDGYSCTATDAEGRYALTRNADAGFVFYSLPSAYKVSVDKTYKLPRFFARLQAGTARYDFTLDDPISSFSEEGLNAVLYGDSEPLTVDLSEFSSSGGRQFLQWEGVAEYIGRTEDDDSKRGQKWRDQFLVYRTCSVCGGSRLKKEALQFRVAGKNIAEVSALSISEFAGWIATVEEQMSDKERRIAQEILKEIRERLRFLQDVGLGYLSLARSSRSLSGGESQRIRLATQIGSKLVNVLYILDEPSIGLHQRDNRRLIRSLEELRDAGNSVIVVEHDEDMMRAADFIVDVGPRAPQGQGSVAAGSFDEHPPLRQHHGRLPDRPAADRDSRLAAPGHGRADRHPRGPGQQPQGGHRRVPARQVHLRDGSQRLGQIDARERNPAPDPFEGALPLLRPAAALRFGRGHRAHRQAGRRRSVAHRALAPLQSGDLFQRLLGHPQTL